MYRNLSTSQKLITYIAYIAMVFSLLYVYGVVIGVELNFFLQFFIVLLGSLAVVFFMKKPLVFYILLVFSMISLLVVHRYVTPILEAVIQRMAALFSNIFNHLQGEEFIFPENVLWFWGILLGIIALFTAFIIFKEKRIYWLLPVYLGSYIYYWYIYIDQAYGMTVVFIVAFLVLFGMNKYFEEQCHWEGTERNRIDSLYGPWIQTVGIYSALIILLAMILPKSGNALEWHWLEDRVYDVFPFVEDMRSDSQYIRGAREADSFEFTSTGFQRESNRLGGPVSLSSRVVMQVEASEPNYLRGNVRHTYQDNRWETITEPSETYDLAEDFSGLTEEEEDEYYRQAFITITHDEFASQSLFTPFKPAEVRSSRGEEVIVNRDGALIFPDGVYQRESYTIKVQKPRVYGELLETDIDLQIEDLEYLDSYLQLPEEEITDRTRELTESIVEEAEAENDYEKARAIEGHLREDYEYNTQVEPLPLNEEFVDHFLFETQEGYCTYYATTMAVMLRLEGIPVRYIEGYVAREEVEDEPGVYEVRQRHAHTWVEAFIEPVGWVNFEPTPAFPQPYRQDALLGMEEEEDLDIDFEQEEADDFGDLGIDADVEVGPGDGDEALDEPETTIPPRVTRGVIIALLLLFIGFMPGRFLYGVLEYRRRERQVESWSSKKKILCLYAYVLELIEKLGQQPREGETHYEFADRIAYKLYEERKIGIKDLTHIFVQSKYGDLPVSDEEVQLFKDYRHRLEGRLKNDWGKRRYLYRKYIKRDFTVKNDKR
ncbi:transglutaminase TgpA family protein [Isachenkonia alkalipeptolytica]|uniref:Transglutaminase domain-containing protein n=1 Tax=Isachenkonia alkalipeptolytica TaxID=2565777 RepID=A0AA44BG35_9CLOT|nr:transglutaminaseTgpA domain-containing protein [Isachenkonia alkalipeptolytica]NBG89066.1 transglutaminase domain-containing protein [Isachenkonia alkalipeptolytica]